MTLRPILAWPLGVLLGALVLAVGTRRLDAAERALDGSRQRLHKARGQALELSRLSSRQERVAVQERPRQDVIALVNSVLAECGIPSTSFQRLDVESDVAVTTADGPAPGRYRRQSLTLVLQRLTTRQLGAFLAEWRDRQAVWTPTRLELTHVREARSSGDLYTASILITATYLSDRTSPR